MTTPQTWMIGAAPECDLVVDHPNVSGRHCQLTRTEAGFELEDLQSTNGTFVNGQRLTEKRIVSTSDEITLGQRVAMPWPPGEISQNRREIRIGRADDNDAIIDSPMVSSYHARIVIAADVTTIEDLGSTNGTGISSPDQKISKSPLTSADTVFFGTLGIPAADLLNASGGTRIPVRPEPAKRPAPTIKQQAYVPPLQQMASTAQPAAQRSPILYVAIGSMAVIIVTLVVALLLMNGGSSSDQPLADGNAAAPPAAASVHENGPKAKEPEDTAVSGPEGALYLVVIKNRSGEDIHQVGTAWAVSETELVTSGAIVRNVQQAKDIYPIVSVIRAATKREFAVSRINAHAEFLKAVETADAAKTELDDLLEKLKETQDPDTIEMLTQQRVEANERFFQAMDRHVFYDLGVISVSGKLPAKLAVAPQSTKPRNGSRVSVLGVPYDQQEHWIDPDTPTSPQKSPARVLGRHEHPSSPNRLSRVILKCDLDLSGQNWAGSPVLNADGEVIAVYSAPTPPPLESNDNTPQVSAHFAAGVGILSDLVGSLR